MAKLRDGRLNDNSSAINYKQLFGKGTWVQCVRCGFIYQKNTEDIKKVKGKWLCKWDIDLDE